MKVCVCGKYVISNNVPPHERSCKEVYAEKKASKLQSENVRLENELKDAKLVIADLEDKAYNNTNEALQTMLALKDVEIEHLKSQLKEYIPRKRRLSERRTIGWGKRLKLACDQDYKCANPFGKCSLPDLKFIDGVFEVDHKVPYRVSPNDDDENLQCLCPSCHSLKTMYDKDLYPY